MPHATESEAGPAVTELAHRVDAFMADADLLTAELWAEVADGPSGSGALSEVIDAARAADGGKLLRPRLVAAAYAAYGGREVPLLRRVAAAQQLLHVGLCIHDDIIDGDRVRHGRLGVVARVEGTAREAGVPAEAARRRGDAAGVLAGDLAISTTVSALISAPAPTAVRMRLAEAALAVIEQAIAGETLDVFFEQADPAATDPLRVAALKTASYSITLPLVLGAIAAGAGDDVGETIARVGGPLGIAYQLHDDDQGLFGSSAATGKPAASDLKAGKRTEHVRRAYLAASPEQRAVLDDLLGRPDLDEAGADALRETVVATGARAEVTALTAELVTRAIRTARAEMPAPLAEYLEGLVAGLTS